MQFLSGNALITRSSSNLITNNICDFLHLFELFVKAQKLGVTVKTEWNAGLKNGSTYKGHIWQLIPCTIFVIARQTQARLALWGFCA